MHSWTRLGARLRFFKYARRWFFFSPLSHRMVPFYKIKYSFFLPFYLSRYISVKVGKLHYPECLSHPENGYRGHHLQTENTHRCTVLHIKTHTEVLTTQTTECPRFQLTWPSPTHSEDGNLQKGYRKGKGVKSGQKAPQGTANSTFTLTTFKRILIQPTPMPALHPN